jgi:hypothetical protein
MVFVENKQLQKRNTGVSPLRSASVEMTTIVEGRDDGFRGGVERAAVVVRSAVQLR